MSHDDSNDDQQEPEEIQRPSDESLENARKRVLQLAREVESLSRESIGPNEFFPEFLGRVVSAIGAQAGAVWLLQGNQIALAAEVRLEGVGLNAPQARQLNDRVLAEVLQTGEACTVASGDGGELQPPTNHMLVLSALHKDKKCVGVVELFQRNDAPEQARAGYLQFLEQMCGYASRYLEGKGKRQDSADAPAGFWSDLEPFTLRLQQTLDSAEVAEIAASDGRLLLDCDRLSVAIKRGNKVSVKAVSGQTSVNPRANLIRAMTALSEQVIAMREPLMYTGRIENLAPQIEKPLANFIQESTSRMVYLVPLMQNIRVVKTEKEVESGRSSGKPRRAIGCLIVEQVAESEPPPALVQRTELVADHVGAALDNARSHEHIFGLKVWRRIGRGLEWFHGRRLATALAILGVLLLAIGALILVPWEYRVEAQGKLMPVVQRTVFAPETGTIDAENLFVNGGEEDIVAGQELMKLRSEDLDLEMSKARSDINNQKKRWTNLQSQIEDAERNGEEPATITKLRGDQLEVDSDIAYHRERLKVLERRRQSLVVTAPINGLIPDFQLRQMLADRPVQRGEKLLEIMDKSQGWHLEVQLEEKRMGHLLRAIEIDKKNGGDGQLDGEYVLQTNPEKRYKCKLRVLATRTSVHPELGTVVELFVDPEELPDKRIGANVRVKLNCGQRSLGYCLFGDVVEFVQKYLWL